MGPILSNNGPSGKPGAVQHFKFWGVVVGRLFESIQKQGLDSDEVRNLERIAAILEKAQKGQRLARGLSLDGQTEEQIRAQAEADGRSLMDLVIEVVKQEVPDPDIQDRISRVLLGRCPTEERDEAEAHG